MLSTYTGRVINPFEMTSEDVDIKDIAHALSLLNRFNGHTSEPISVAQHSVCVAALLFDQKAPMPIVRQALFHDASEAYLGDVTKWLKQTPAFEQYRKLEHRVQQVIFAAVGCPSVLDPRVEAADKFMVRYEAHHYHPMTNLFTLPGYPLLTLEEQATFTQFTALPWVLAEETFHIYERATR